MRPANSPYRLGCHAAVNALAAARNAALADPDATVLVCCAEVSSAHFHHTARLDQLIAGGKVVLEPITYIRGRSIPHQFIIVDEAQNLSPHEVKTIVSRVGDGTKIVLCGDIGQIDNPYLDAASNGLAHAIERMKGQRIAGHVTLSKTERSELASLAAEIL